MCVCINAAPRHHSMSGFEVWADSGFLAFLAFDSPSWLPLWILGEFVLRKSRKLKVVYTVVAI